MNFATTFRPAEEVMRVHLLPGTLHCASRPTEVVTVLGSCVAVCLTDRGRGISGMNHFVLPASDTAHSGLRYGDVAIDVLIENMRRLGSCAAALEAKIFGGADVLAKTARGISVGARNVAAAEERLEQHGIPIVARRTGETGGYFIRLLTDSGDVLVRPLTPTAQGALIDPLD